MFNTHIRQYTENTEFNVGSLKKTSNIIIGGLL